ncbi:unnamed protein product [Mycena citricolor]|uniref:DNA repair protein REV1 n=1 Tax=Mycena citricolor TaxID=2018698 RepID=A0AAD2H4N7_9AGAR|nr:unnamed protein product [Mycena citricolor]
MIWDDDLLLTVTLTSLQPLLLSTIPYIEQLKLAAPRASAGSTSSDYFEDDDPEFLAALNHIALPGDVVSVTAPAQMGNSDSESDLEPPPPAQMARPLKRRHELLDPVDEEVYGEAHFGGFGEYMHRKRAKLQIQNSESGAAKSGIFKGVAIHVNGWTSPSVQELKQLIMDHGGIFQPYLDKKSLVTHIITCTLTEAKRRDFKNMKIVRPEWLIESVKAGTLLSWRDFMFLGPTSAARHTVSSTPSLHAQAALSNQSELPRYAAVGSNPNAKRAMADSSWRAAHTSAAPDFIQGYFEHSRLHFLSATKAELVQLVREAQNRAESNKTGNQDAIEIKGMPSPVKGKVRAGEDRVIMHCDFDCFFVSAGLLAHPELRGKPVVVCHSQGGQGGGNSTSEIASASYEARDFGIKNGMSLQQAQKLCPGVQTMPYEFERYKSISLKFYTVLMSRADDVEAVSIDEALIEVTTFVRRLQKTSLSDDPAKEFADNLRAQVKEATGCEVSIGISHNILLARLATRQAKPAGSKHVKATDVPELMATLQITDIWGFARSQRDKALEKFGSAALIDLANRSQATLCEALGKKTGERLYNTIRGIDDTPLRSDKQRKSVSVEINYGIRFEDSAAARKFVYSMAEKVEERLNDIQMLGRSVNIKLMKRDPAAPVEAPKFMGHGVCQVFNKQVPLASSTGRATNDRMVIGEHAWRVIQSYHFDPRELRGIGIQIQKLEPATGPVPSNVNQKTLGFKPVEADRQVLETLPLELRQEVEQDLRRMSESPFPEEGPARAQSRPHSGRFSTRIVPTRYQQNALRLPNGGGSGYVIDKNTIHPNRPANPFLRPTDTDLKALGIDPETFAALPRNVKREQLALARMVKKYGAVPEVDDTHKVHKPRKFLPPPDLFRQPPPFAKYPEPPKIRRPGPKGQKPFFSEKDDVQDLLGAWIDAFKRFSPEEKDVNRLAEFLVSSVDSKVSTDIGVERAVSVMKWWAVLLRRYWQDYEVNEDLLDDAVDEAAAVGEAWWKAFRDVKERLDVVARKKFGGRLSIR